LAISTTFLAERIRWPAVAMRPAVAVFAALTLIVGGFFLSRTSFAHSRGIEVSGRDRLSRADIVQLAGVSKATNVVWLDAESIERSLETHPWVARAEVDIVFPATIRIRIVERVPVAVVSDGLVRTLVAADGTPLGEASRARELPRIDLPMAAGVDARAWPSAGMEAPHGVRPLPQGAAAALGAMNPGLRADVVSVRVEVDGTMTLRLSSGVHVRYGRPAAPTAKAETIERILEWGRAMGEHIANVNVVSPRTPAVRLDP
jgi:cell division protein FtsQ